MNSQVPPSRQDDRSPDARTLLCAIAEQLSELIYATDLEGQLTYVSPASVRMTGWTPDEILGRHFSTWLGAGSIQPAIAMFRDTVESGRPAEAMRLTLRRKDGTTFVGELNATRLTDGTRTLGTTGVIRDITRYVAAEAALRESEERYRVLFESISDAVFVNEVNADNTPGRFLQVNDVACRRLGYTREELLELTPREITTLQAYSEAARSREHLAEQGSALMESIHVTKDGRHLPVEGNIRYLTYLGHTAALSISRDLTHRRRAEAERLEIERRVLQVQKYQSLGQLAGGVAHDFNNILVAILGHAELAVSDLSESSPARDHLAQIKVAANRAASLCRQMLACSGRGRFVVERVDLNALVSGILSLLKSSVSKCVSLTVCLAEQLPPCRADATQLRQLVVNLVTNASEAIGDADGAVTISTGVVSCSASDLAKAAFADGAAPGTYVRLEVSDTGCGMDESTARQVFEPFFSTKFTGRGLGMAAVLGIARAHQGAITIESAVGRGTTVRVLFPAEEPTRLSGPSAGPPAVQPA